MEYSLVVCRSCASADAGEELGTGLCTAAQEAGEGRSARGGAGSPNTTQCHAGVLCFHDNTYTLGRKVGVEMVGDLLGQTFLGLWPVGELLHHPRQLRQTDDPRVREVAHMGHPGERQKVVFTHPTAPGST